MEPSLSQTFYGQLRPISEQWQPEALAISGFTREQTLAFPEPEGAMRQFAAWLGEHSRGRLMFISDNNGFDWQFINKTMPLRNTTSASVTKKARACCRTIPRR